MTAIILDAGEDDLEQAFDYYESVRPGLGLDLVQEFRAAVDRILEHPNAWQPLDPIYRRRRLHRFPYGVIYRVDVAGNRIVIVAVSHLSRAPGWWRGRDL